MENSKENMHFISGLKGIEGVLHGDVFVFGSNCTKITTAHFFSYMTAPRKHTEQDIE